ncbi:RHS repeat-associated core domain-containing protein [Treponema denticola]|uniref:RHS repeat-associated core domain-containing protein n=1 Tax=Treponema denticola H-22 TaxID=999432 RepID=A0A0E2E647_TREDN|nr:RHS repeat-associated core domain-containing protein [Treponema denticola H-22]
MKTSYLFKHSNYLIFRTAIAREQKQFIKIAFAVHLSAAISAERYRSDSGALKSAVLNFVFFILIKNKIEQSACQSCLKNNLLEVFPLTVGSGKTMAFENRWSRYKEIGKKVPQAYRVYVEDTFLPCDAGDARIFSKEHEHGLRVSKHIFVGNSRLVTAMTHADNNGDTTEQTEKRYYYHADHLQSAQFITNARGEQYEHIEYTPYGELWIEETAPGIDKLPFRFTGKELDEETGLYYYGARYLDPKYSRWLSGDPALNEYIPKAPIDEEAKKHNENLPGMGGIYNTVNLHVYHYAGNNPIKYTDPDGKWFFIDDLLVSIFAKLEGLQDEGIFQGMWMYFKASWMHPIDYGKAFIKFVKFIYEKYKVLKIPINNKLKFFIDWEKKRIGVKTPDIKETEMNIPEFKIFENNDKENMQ